MYRDRLRLATYNVALGRGTPGALARQLAGGCAQARAVATIIRRVRPDILLLNEFDHDAAGQALTLFQARYLQSGVLPGSPLHYPWTHAAAVNSGVPTGIDLDRDGRCDGPGDALGFGRFAGEYGMALLSRYPIQHALVRSFRRFPWWRLPGALMPRDPEDGSWWYPASIRQCLPLSSKSHWDVPIRVAGRDLHVLASHPTPPVFDGPEQRNRLRNRDEIRFWSLYLDGWVPSDDTGNRTALPPGAWIAVLGDLNADPHAGAGEPDAIRTLLAHRRLQDPTPTSDGGAAVTDGAAGNPARHTAAFDGAHLRVDYVLPDRRLAVTGAGVFWPAPSAGEAALIAGPARQPASSDHRLVWVDVGLE